MDEWLDIEKDGIPDYCGRYLVVAQYQGGEIIIARIDDDHFTHEETGVDVKASHWMRLPFYPSSDQP